MANRPPEPHFRAVWYLSMANVCILTVLAVLQYGWGIEYLASRDLALWAFAWFLAPEWAAGGVNRRKVTGTKTGFLFWTVTDRWPRVLMGVWMGQLVFWMFPNDAFGSPDWLPIGYLLGGVLTLWLPPHYWRRGQKGPVDHAAIWLARKLNLEELFEKIRRGG